MKKFRERPARILVYENVLSTLVDSPVLCLPNSATYQLYQSLNSSLI